MKKGESRNGFTIIEVVLVLAIAGLIFIMIFVALPALQRSQRDSQRRDDLAKFISEVKRYQTNNRGALPGADNTFYPVTVNAGDITDAGSHTWAGFYRDYLGDKFVDPDGERYGLSVVKCGEKTKTDGGACEDQEAQKYIKELMDPDSTSSAIRRNNILVVTQAKCDRGNVVASSNPRNLAVLYRLETDTYCDAT